MSLIRDKEEKCNLWIAWSLCSSVCRFSRLLCCSGTKAAVRGGKMLTWHLHFQRHSRLFGSILLSTIILSADNHSKGVGWRGCDNKEEEEDCVASWLLAASVAGVAS